MVSFNFSPGTKKIHGKIFSPSRLRKNRQQVWWRFQIFLISNASRWIIQLKTNRFHRQTRTQSKFFRELIFLVEINDDPRALFSNEWHRTFRIVSLLVNWKENIACFFWRHAHIDKVFIRFSSEKTLRLRTNPMNIFNYWSKIHFRIGFHLTVNQLCFRPLRSNKDLQLAGCSADGTVRIFTIRLNWSVFNQREFVFCRFSLFLFVASRRRRNNTKHFLFFWWCFSDQYYVRWSSFKSTRFSSS